MSVLGIIASLTTAWVLHGTSWAIAGYILAVATVWSNGILLNFSTEEIHADAAPVWAVVAGPSTAILSFISLALALFVDVS